MVDLRRSACVVGWCLAGTACGRVDFDRVGDAPLGSDASDASDAAPSCTATALPNYEQGGCVTNHSLPPIASLVVPLPNPIVAPNVLVLAVDFDGVTMVPMFTDSLGNTFEVITALSRSNAQSSQIAYAPITNEGTDSVTVSFAAPTDGIGFYVHEYSGLSTTDAVAAFVVGMGNGNALSTGDVTTTTPGQLLFAHAVIQTTIASAGNGFTARQTCNANMTEDAVASTPGAHSADFIGSSGGTWIASLATFWPSGCP